jgi:hypothetical protein
VSPRAIWIVGLGGALAVLAALNFLRPQQTGSGGVEPRPSPTSERARSGDGVAAPQTDDASPRPNGAADASVAPSADASTEPNAAGPLLPNRPAATPMGDILAARGIQAPPWLLETEHTFAAEPRDPDWSTAAETQILAKFAETPGLALASLEVECRQTLCRLQFVAPRTVAEGPPSAEQIARLRAGPQVPGIAELVRATGLKGRSVFAFSPISMAYLERGEAADTPAATR